MIIELQTRDGGLVAKYDNRSFDLMKPLPEIVLWGERFFVYTTMNVVAGEINGALYKEGLCWPLYEFQGLCKQIE